MSAHRAFIGDRLQAMSTPVPEAGCWLWLGRTAPNGYGRMGAGRNRQYAAHRVSWEFHRGPIPAGLIVCHKCDTRRCINPDHLFLGTHADNARDRDAKGRGGFGRNGGGWNRGIPQWLTHPNGNGATRRAAGGQS